VKKRSGEVRSRRELFAGALRYGTLAVLTAGGAGMFAKRRRLVREGKCINKGICAGCEVLERCDLPEALSARETLVGADNVRR
jgi:hypothetical protein